GEPGDEEQPAHVCPKLRKRREPQARASQDLSRGKSFLTLVPTSIRIGLNSGNLRLFGRVALRMAGRCVPEREPEHAGDDEPRKSVDEKHRPPASDVQLADLVR